MLVAKTHNGIFYTTKLVQPPSLKKIEAIFVHVSLSECRVDSSRAC